MLMMSNIAPISISSFMLDTPTDDPVTRFTQVICVRARSTTSSAGSTPARFSDRTELDGWAHRLAERTGAPEAGDTGSEFTGD